jgi:hypothetical protein
MVIRIEIITPAQRAELEAALRPYEHELEPDWIEPPDYFRRKLEAMFRDPDRRLWWAADESGSVLALPSSVNFAIGRMIQNGSAVSQNSRSSRLIAAKDMERLWPA